MIVAVGIDFESELDAEPHNGAPDYWDYHERQFGGRVGVWRMLDVLQKHQIDATFFVCAALLGTYPDACREIAKGGYEIAAHTIYHEHLDQMNSNEEDIMFRRMLSLFDEFYGTRPVGFRTCFPSSVTLDFVGEYGFFYDTTNRDEDAPYLEERPGHGSFIEIPRGFNGDAPLIGTPVATRLATGKYNAPSSVGATWRREFDWLYDEGEADTRIMTLCLHPYISGRPSRAKALDDFLSYTKTFTGVRYATHLELAHWYTDRNRDAVVASGTPIPERVAGTA